MSCMPMARLSSSRALLLTVCFLAAIPALRQMRAEEPPPPKKQLPADERAFNVARANMEPEKRLAAMRAFVHEFPKSNRVGKAQNFILDILLKTVPAPVADIDAQANRMVGQAGKGQSRYNEEVDVAFQLAEAGQPGTQAGIDLPLAEKLASDALKHLKEPEYDKDQIAKYARYKMAAPKPDELHKGFAGSRSEALAILADVYLRQGRKAQAAPLISEAFALDPLIDDVNSQRGRLALLDHDDALALESFERAQLVGALAPADRQTMLQLYRRSHGDSEAGLVEEMDARYAQFYPAPFTPTKSLTLPAGHTVLLELFTGSGCPPCVGGDLAVEGLLEAYPRSEIVALAFDQHIPEPDPLANPDSVARAHYYGVGTTPMYVLDGGVQPLYGSARDGSKDLYEQITKLVQSVASTPAANIQISLTAAQSGGLIHAHATVTMPGDKEIEAALTATPAPGAAKATESTTGKDEKAVAPAAPAKAAEAVPPSEPQPSHLVVNFALVEDDVRYSGENGMRFHRMVVRALAKPADSGFAVIPAEAASLDASFDPASISQALATYLDTYEQHNDRFGKITFITKDMTMRPNHLAVAAWVQDSVTHKVLQTAIVSVGAAEEEQKAAE